MPFTVSPRTMIVRDGSGSHDEDIVNCSPVCWLVENVASTLPTDACASASVTASSLLASAELVGHDALPEARPLIATTCGSPCSRPAIDRLSFSLSPPVTSSVPGPLRPEPCGLVSVAVKCCAPVPLGVVVGGGAFAEGFAETHFPKALASCALAP